MSPWAHRSKYSRSSFGFSGWGNEPLPPDRCRVKNNPFKIKKIAGDNIVQHLPFTVFLTARPLFPLLHRNRVCLRLSKKSFRPKDSEGRIVGKGTVRVPFP